MQKKIEFKIIGDCHECTSHCRCSGYPHIWRNGKHWRMSRYLYTQKHGEIPKGKIIRHTCDNPACINIDHLIIGTVQDNINDKIKRGRQHRGSEVANSILTESNILQILKLKGKLTKKQIGIKYGVSKATIKDVLSGKSWKHVDRIKEVSHG